MVLLTVKIIPADEPFRLFDSNPSILGIERGEKLRDTDIVCVNQFELTCMVSSFLSPNFN